MAADHAPELPKPALLLSLSDIGKVRGYINLKHGLSYHQLHCSITCHIHMMKNNPSSYSTFSQSSVDIGPQREL